MLWLRDDISPIILLGAGELVKGDFLPEGYLGRKWGFFVLVIVYVLTFMMELIYFI